MYAGVVAMNPADTTYVWEYVEQSEAYYEEIETEDGAESAYVDSWKGLAIDATAEGNYLRFVNDHGIDVDTFV